MGFKTIAIGRGRDKEEMAKKLGAIHYIDSITQNVAEELFKFRGSGGNDSVIDSSNSVIGSGGNGKGAKVILATAPSSKAISSAFGGQAVNGKLIVVGAANEPIEIHPFLLIGRRSIIGWPSGSSIDSQDTLSFAIHSGVMSVKEVFPIEQASEAYDRMISSKVKFRDVLQPKRRFT
jgi:D-arabinose 1-dehydrogenase-like Zn-dependent alcohol dehydrogenase